MDHIQVGSKSREEEDAIQNKLEVPQKREAPLSDKIAKNIALINEGESARIQLSDI